MLSTRPSSDISPATNEPEPEPSLLVVALPSVRDEEL